MPQREKNGTWSGSLEWGLGADRFWGLEVRDEDRDIVVAAEAPGFEPKDFDIQVTDNTLSIRAEHREESRQGEGESRFFETRRSRFQRLIPLPDNVDAERVDARYKNGVLELRLPKTQQSPRRRIEVKS
jgi:HSP20 family protein